MPQSIANKVYNNPYYVQNRYLEFVKPIRNKKKYKVYKFKGDLKNISKMKGMDILFLLLFHLLGLIPKRENYKPLSPEIRQEVRKMERYSKEIRLIITEKIKTVEDVKSYISQTEENIKDVASIRQKYRNKLKNCTDDKLIKDYKIKRDECANVLNTYRKNLKTANCILEDVPKVKEVIKIEKQMKLEQMEVTKTKKKNKNLSR